MFAESIKEIQFPVEKQNLYVRNSFHNVRMELEKGRLVNYVPVDSLSYVGECLINMEDKTVYQIGKNVRYTPTQDLIEQVLTEYGKFTTHIIYYSKDKSAIYINVYFDKRMGHTKEYRLALEISNHYSGRYSPKVTLSLYNIHKDLMIRTPLSAFNPVELLKLSKISDAEGEFCQIVHVDWDVIKLLPKKYQNFGLKGHMTLLTALNIIAEICSKWLETNYELATETQKKIYNILTNKFVEE